MADEHTDPRQKALAAIRALSADYLAGLPAKLDAMEQAWIGISSGGAGIETIRELHRAVHGVTGSGRTFGLPLVSEAARTLEADLQSLLTAEEPPGVDMKARIKTGLRQLRTAADAAPSVSERQNVVTDQTPAQT